MPSEKLTVYRFLVRGLKLFLDNFGDMHEEVEYLRGENNRLKEQHFLDTANKVIGKRRKKK